MTWLWIVIGSIVGVGVVGCGIGSSGPVDDGDRIVTTWSQATSDGEPLQTVVGPSTLVVDTEADRDALLERVPESLSVSEVEAVDLTTHVIVAGGYHRCTETSSVAATDDGWRFVVSDGDQDTDCAWSPYTIDVWAVPRDQ